MTKIISVLLAFMLISLITGCAGLTGPQLLAFRGSPVRETSDPPAAIFSGAGTIGPAGGLLIDEFEKKWSQFR